MRPPSSHRRRFRALGHPHRPQPPPPAPGSNIPMEFLLALPDIPLWLWLEHAAVALLLATTMALAALLARLRPKEGAAAVPTGKTLPALAEVQLGAVAAVKALAGPKGVLRWPDVYDAPAASMDMSSLQDGEVMRGGGREWDRWGGWGGVGGHGQGRFGWWWWLGGGQGGRGGSAGKHSPGAGVNLWICVVVRACVCVWLCVPVRAFVRQIVPDFHTCMHADWSGGDMPRTCNQPSGSTWPPRPSHSLPAEGTAWALGH